MQWFAVALGGALGSLARYAINLYVIGIFSERSPLGTLLVNLTGSILIGCCYALVVEKGFFPTELRSLLYKIYGEQKNRSGFHSQLNIDRILFTSFRYCLIGR